jgi:hypothetical protein
MPSRDEDTSDQKDRSFNPLPGDGNKFANPRF